MRREDRRGSRLEPKVLESHRGVLSKMRECAVVRWVSGPAACDATQGSRSPGLRTPTGNDQIIIPFCCVHSSHGIHDQKEKKIRRGDGKGREGWRRPCWAEWVPRVRKTGDAKGSRGCRSAPRAGRARASLGDSEKDRGRPGCIWCDVPRKVPPWQLGRQISISKAVFFLK